MWTLVLLGEARLVSATQGSIALERKAAGLLAYLAFEGATGRSRLAGLLWPDSDEGQARANLRQTLSRIRKVAPELLDGEDPMRLQGVHVDVLQTKARAMLGRLTSFSGDGRILPRFDYDDCPEFLLWLQAESESLRRLVGTALEAEVSRRIEAGQVGAALEPTLQLVRLDPFSEEAHRRLIGLHHLRGDHAAAEQAYRSCCRILEEELGVSPSRATHEMAALGRGAGDGTAGAGPRAWAPPPASGPLVSRRLVARDEVWERMERAWRAQKIFFLAGPPGIGKTRLAAEFLASRPPTMLKIENRPGDSLVPYAPIARGIREALRNLPHLDLEPWVRRELSRILPEFAEGEAHTSSPLDDPFSRLRFHDAHVELLRAICRWDVTLWIEDLHCCDEPTAALGNYLFYAQANGDFTTPSVVTYRPQSMPKSIERVIRDLIAKGRAEWVELAPLTGDEVVEFMEGLDPPMPATLGTLLHQLVGGNPGTILQALESTWVSSSSEDALGAAPEAELRRKLVHLSEGAMQLAKVAAVAGEAFSPALAAALLGTHPMSLAEPWLELEEAQILEKNRFVRDLFEEAVLASVPAALRAHLQEAISTYQAGAPARGDGPA